MPRVAIVDYGLCNLDSIGRAVEECGGHPVVTTSPAEVLAADRIVLPGVGAFPEAMANLRRDGLADALQSAVIGKGRPFLGICLGMQLIASRGVEVRETDGLGWIEATVVRLNGGPGVRVPHVGWNQVDLTREDPLFEGLPRGADVYFVHSFAVTPHDETQVLARTPFGPTTFVSAIRRDNVWGVQFHPEKSQRLGFMILRNFIRSLR